MTSEFKVFTIEPYITIVQPILIVIKKQGAYQNTIDGEYFIIIPDEEKTLIFKEVKIINDSKCDFDFNDSDECLMTREIKSASEMEIKRYYINKYGNSILLNDVCKVRFIESNKDIICRYMMRGTFKEYIRQIRQLTECDSLLSFLNNLRNLPQITFLDSNGYKSPYE